MTNTNKPKSHERVAEDSSSSRLSIYKQSEVVRRDAHESVMKILKKIHFDEMSTAQKIDWLKNTNFDDFMNYISFLNGKLRKSKKRQRWEGKSKMTIVNSAGVSSDETVALESPENAHNEFRKVYRELQSNIDEENYKSWALKLYAGIVFSHMFSDGNGRTARNVYLLLSDRSLPNVEKTTIRPKGKAIENFCELISENAIFELFKKHKILDNKSKINDMAEHVANENGFDGLGGTMNSLRYLAVKQTLKECGIEVKEKVFALSSLTSEQRRIYEIHYKTLKVELLHEIQNLIGRHAEYLVSKLDSILLGGEKAPL